MKGYFDKCGDLWITIDLKTVPENSRGLTLSSFAKFDPEGSGRFSAAATGLNLTAYIRGLTQPSWLSAALSSSTAKI